MDNGNPSLSASASSPPLISKQQQVSPTTSFFCSPRMDREASCSSDLSAHSTSTGTGSSSDETEIATPPVVRVEGTIPKEQQGALSFDRSNGGPRAHYRTTDMLQFEGRDHPGQVWICNRKPSSPLPGYIPTPSMTPGLDGGQTAQDCYFATISAGSSTSLSTAEEASSNNTLHLGLRPNFVHSETVPDVHALAEQHEAAHRAHHHLLVKNQHHQDGLRQENPILQITPNLSQNEGAAIQRGHTSTNDQREVPPSKLKEELSRDSFETHEEEKVHTQ